MTAAQITYFKPLNGFRGLAAILILLYHSLFPCFKALWIGVPMFFVLSGFLITRILLENKTSGNFLKAFYLRRALRIFPIYYLALLISVFWCLLVKGDFNLLPAFVVYLQSFFISHNVEPKYCYGLMNHTWSLSVEELFYLCWPLIVLLTNRKTLLACCILIGLSGIFYKIILIGFFYTNYTNELILLSLFGNVDGLMAGALLAMISLNKQAALYRTFPLKLFWLTIALFITFFAGNYFTFHDPRNALIFKACLDLSILAVSFYLIAWFIVPGHKALFPAGAFNHPVLQFTGKISYGLYLYHALIYGMTSACVYHFHMEVHPIPLLAFKIGLTFAVAILSWRYVEKPLLRLKDRINYRSRHAAS